jgi:hypothetical protein
MIEPHSIVVATLTNPREKIWGELLALRPEGITMRGIRLEAFEDFLHQILQQRGDSISMSTAFYPMHRVERVDCDEPCEGIPSLADQFREKVGLTVHEYLDGGAPTR